MDTLAALAADSNFVLLVSAAGAAVAVLALDVWGRIVRDDVHEFEEW